MKTIKFLSLVALSLILFSCIDKKQDTNQKNSKKVANKIEVIDFHSTHRCITCKAIEANTKYTLETFFSEELNNGDITFQVINVDEDKNFKTAEKFQASGTALILNVIIDGNEKQIDLTDFAFLKGKKKDVFSKELKLKLEAELKLL